MLMWKTFRACDVVTSTSLSLPTRTCLSLADGMYSRTGTGRPRVTKELQRMVTAMVMRRTSCLHMMPYCVSKFTRSILSPKTLGNEMTRPVSSGLCLRTRTSWSTWCQCRSSFNNAKATVNDQLKGSQTQSNELNVNWLIAFFSCPYLTCALCIDLMRCPHRCSLVDNTTLYYSPSVPSTVVRLCGELSTSRLGMFYVGVISVLCFCCNLCCRVCIANIYLNHFCACSCFASSCDFYMWGDCTGFYIYIYIYVQFCRAYIYKRLYGSSKCIALSEHMSSLIPSLSEVCFNFC